MKPTGDTVVTLRYSQCFVLCCSTWFISSGAGKERRGFVGDSEMLAPLLATVMGVTEGEACQRWQGSGHRGDQRLCSGTHK